MRCNVEPASDTRNILCTPAHTYRHASSYSCACCQTTATGLSAREQPHAVKPVALPAAAAAVVDAVMLKVSRAGWWAGQSRGGHELTPAEAMALPHHTGTPARKE